MGLHQINVAYQPAHDRLLLRASTTDRLEYRLWLTRRLVKGLWPALLRLLQASEPVRLQPAPASKAAVLEFRHEKALGESRFGERYEGDELRPARPGDPLLVARVDLRPAGAGHYRLEFLPRPGDGEGVALQLTESLLHALVKLLQDGVRKTEWDIALSLPAPGAPAPADRKVN